MTDVLFEISDPTKTGIDLTAGLREAFHQDIGIIVYTAFTTPFIAMSAYSRGALAVLVFQKEYFRRVREQCSALANSEKTEEFLADKTGVLISIFERTLPKHTVSPHMAQEWEDTYFLLKMMQTSSGTRNKDAKKALKEFEARY